MVGVALQDHAQANDRVGATLSVRQFIGGEWELERPGQRMGDDIVHTLRRQDLDALGVQTGDDVGVPLGAQDDHPSRRGETRQRVDVDGLLHARKSTQVSAASETRDPTV